MIRLNEKEEEIMGIFWKLKKAFPKEIIHYLKEPIPPYNTVLSIIRKLEKEGLLFYNKIGRSHQYIPKISKIAYQKSLLKHLLKEYFSDSPKSLLSFFIKEEKLSELEINELLKDFKNKDHETN